MKLFVDGDLETTGTGNTHSLTIPTWIGIGNNPCDAATHNRRWFNGTIDEVRILNRSLTAEEIKEDYQSPASTILSLSTNQQNYTLGETVQLNLTLNYTKNKPPVYASVKLELQKPAGNPYTIIETPLINFKPGFYKSVVLSYPIPNNMWICSGDYAFKVYMTDNYGNLIASDSAKFYINATKSSKSISNFI